MLILFNQDSHQRILDLGVIAAGAIVWKTQGSGRFYADPAVSMFISLIIFASAIPLSKQCPLSIFRKLNDS